VPYWFVINASFPFKDGGLILLNDINQYGTVRSYYAFHRVTHSEGWIAILQQGTVNKLEFENADQVTNISYSAIFYEFYVSSLCSKIQY
jgi:hypothetical protein